MNINEIDPTYLPASSILPKSTVSAKSLSTRRHPPSAMLMTRSLRPNLDDLEPDVIPLNAPGANCLKDESDIRADWETEMPRALVLTTPEKVQFWMMRTPVETEEMDPWARFP